MSTNEPEARQAGAEVAPHRRAGGVEPRGLHLHDARVREALLYLVTIALTCLGMYWFLELWRTDLHVLMINSQDSRFIGMLVKGMLKHGWYLVNPDIGAPGVLNMADWPAADTLHMLVLKVIGTFTGDYAASMNLYYLLTYPLAAVSALYVMRRLAVSRASAFVASLLFAFIPFHYLRGTAHIYYSAYYLIPLIILLALRLGWKAPPFFGSSHVSGRTLGFAPTTPTAIACAAIAIAVGMSGAYFAFFACFVLLAGGVYAALRARSWQRLSAAGILIALIVVVFAIQMVPTWVFQAQNGPNAYVNQRSTAEGDLYALRVSQLILPLPTHRFAAVSQPFQDYWRQLYRAEPYTETENTYVALGLVAALGFLTLLLWLVLARFRAGRTASRFSRLMDDLSVLNMACLLLGTVGGVGSILAIAAPQIRAYNRISIFIAFLALLAVALLLDALADRVGDGHASKGILLAFCAVVFVWGFLDQTTPAALPDYPTVAANDRSDVAIVGRLEAALPAGASVFQLPYVDFPEGGSTPGGIVGTMWDYQHFRGPLHSSRLRWSYGAMKGRPDASWNQRVAGLPAGQMIVELQARGFKAVWIDRTGYTDNGDGIVGEVAAAINGQPLASQDGQVAAFVLP